jgi:hypothetical protein
MQDRLLCRLVTAVSTCMGIIRTSENAPLQTNAADAEKSHSLTDEPGCRFTRARFQLRRSRKLSRGPRLEFGHRRSPSALAFDLSQRRSAACLSNVARRRGFCGSLQVVRLAAVQKRALPPSALPGLQLSL